MNLKKILNTKESRKSGWALVFNVYLYLFTAAIGGVGWLSIFAAAAMKSVTPFLVALGVVWLLLVGFSVITILIVKEIEKVR